MLLPALGELSTTRDMIMEFKGYNHNLYVEENQFYNMQNMTSSFYPVLSPRLPRGYVRQFTKPNGLMGKDKLCWVDGTTFYYDNTAYGTVADSKKQFVSMGAYVLIFPDKKYFNTATKEFGSLENTVVTIGTVTYTLTKADAVDYGAYTVSATAPTSPADGALWLDISLTPNALKQYSNYSGVWTSIPTTYVKIAANGIGAGFKKYDGVTISGSTNAMFNTDAIIQAVDTNYIVVIGILSATFTQSIALTVKRKVPDMEYLTESENRVWGCSSAKHEIYSCKQGDPFNWNCFMGISTDSYAVTIGTDGDFTGAFTHLGYVLFFKEDVIHKIQGSQPSNYQVTNSKVRGVEKGSEGSLVIVNETLYYKSRNGICAYEGGLPASISDVLGSDKYINGVGGALGNKYYISMQDASNVWHLFVYDERKGLWHHEDNTHALCFTSVAGKLYYIDSANKMYLAENDGSVTNEDLFEWSAETGDIGVNSPDNKYVSKIQVRLTVETGASFRIALQYDSDNVWHEKYVISATTKKSIAIPIIPNRCDHMRIKFSGKGSCKVYSITKTVEMGSEI